MTKEDIIKNIEQDHKNRKFRSCRINPMELAEYGYKTDIEGDITISSDGVIRDQEGRVVGTLEQKDQKRLLENGFMMFAGELEQINYALEIDLVKLKEIIENTTLSYSSVVNYLRRDTKNVKDSTKEEVYRSFVETLKSKIGVINAILKKQ